MVCVLTSKLVENVTGLYRFLVIYSGFLWFIVNQKIPEIIS
jgi:hypothetical protein